MEAAEGRKEMGGRKALASGLSSSSSARSCAVKPSFGHASSKLEAEVAARQTRPRLRPGVLRDGHGLVEGLPADKRW